MDFVVLVARVDAVRARRGRLLHLLEDVRGPVERVLALLPSRCFCLSSLSASDRALRISLSSSAFSLATSLSASALLPSCFSMKAISFFAQPFSWRRRTRAC